MRIKLKYLFSNKVGCTISLLFIKFLDSNIKIGIRLMSVTMSHRSTSSKHPAIIMTRSPNAVVRKHHFWPNFSNFSRTPEFELENIASLRVFPQIEEKMIIAGNMNNDEIINI